MGHCCLCSVGLECHAKVCANSSTVCFDPCSGRKSVPPDPYPLGGGARWSHNHCKGFTCLYCTGDVMCVYMCVGELLCTVE